MPRCNDCGKFVSIEEEDPEVNEETINDDGTYLVTIRIVNSCGACGTELRESQLDFGGDFELSDKKIAKHSDDFRMEVEDVGRTGKSEGTGRGTKTFYGAEAMLTLYGRNDKELASVHVVDYVQASHMDDI